MVEKQRQPPSYNILPATGIKSIELLLLICLSPAIVSGEMQGLSLVTYKMRTKFLSWESPLNSVLFPISNRRKTFIFT